MDNFSDNLKGKKTKKVTSKTKTINLNGGGVKEITETKVVPIKKKKQPKPKVYKSVGDEILATLSPLRKSMMRMLESRGIKTASMTFPAIIANFNNEFLTKKEDKTSTQPEITVSEFENDMLFKIPQGTPVDNIGVSDVALSVGSVVNFFKKANSKRKAAKRAKVPVAQALTPTEQLASKEVEKVTKTLEKEVKKDEPVKQGSAKKYILFGVGGLVLVLLVVMIARK